MLCNFYMGDSISGYSVSFSGLWVLSEFFLQTQILFHIFHMYEMASRN